MSMTTKQIEEIDAAIEAAIGACQEAQSLDDLRLVNGERGRRKIVGSRMTTAMNTLAKAQRDLWAQQNPVEVIERALRSQGARHSRAALEELAAHLMAGGAPRTYGERFAQMALIQSGLIQRA